MHILLDTSYLYDLMEAPGKFSDAERRFFTAPEARLYVSAVSIWEISRRQPEAFEARVRASSELPQGPFHPR